MYIIGLTGGIGCGKSTVGDLFKQQGARVIDADEVGKTLVQPHTPLLAAITEHFGTAILRPDGTLDRETLRHKIFQNPSERKKLEALLHPAILAEMREQAQHAKAPYCIFSIPLLIETGQTQYVNRILVVDLPETLQRERVAKRSGLSQAQISRILEAQTSRENRLHHADDVIDNRFDIAKLAPQVTALHKKYITLANATPSQHKH